MQAWAEKRVAELEKEDLSGFIFKAKSPSSGMARVKLYDRNGSPNSQGVGLFAKAFMQHFPLLPVEEDGRLHDPRLRENFIETIFTLKRWRESLKDGRSRKALIDFHSRHKLLIMAHSPEIYRQLGRLVASGKDVSTDRLYEEYMPLLMKALHLLPTSKKHLNVMQHILGYFKKELSSDEKQEVLQLLENYRAGLIPLIVPTTLLNHFVRKYQQPYLMQQAYLNPHPIELQLRNHV
jgi:uncharacterized protein YbgA (DUF1722 family)